MKPTTGSIPLMDALAMREADRCAIQEIGIPGVLLMETAGRQVVEVLVRDFAEALLQGVTILCGKGNNGGDGYVIARYLHTRGVAVTVVILANEGDIGGDAALHLAILRRCGITPHFVTAPELWSELASGVLKAGVVVDALLGTGITNEIKGIHHQVITDLNAARRPVVAVDIPSGIDASTGKVLGVSVKSVATVTLAVSKPGLWMEPGRSCAGRVHVADIGLPRQCVPDQNLCGEVSTLDSIQHLLPLRPRDGHKGTFGHVLVVAGSVGKIGAAILTSSAVLRAGAGLVTVAVPESALGTPMVFPPEVMVEPLPSSPSGQLGEEAIPRLLMLIQAKDGLAIGPGLGGGPGVARVVAALLGHLPTVIDADALAPLPLEHLPGASQTVITPHPGEAARMLSVTSAEIQSHRRNYGLKLAETLGCVALLKGSPTLITDPEGWLVVNPTGNPGMATGGSGDVLTGIIAGLLAQGLTPLDAAVVGAYLHGLAGDLAAAETSGTSLVASDLLGWLGRAFRMVEQAGAPRG